MPAPAAEQAGGEWLLRQEGVRVPVAPVQSCPTGTPHSASPVWWVLLSQVHISGGPTGEVGGLTRVTIFGGSGSDCRASLVQTRLPSLHGSWLPPVTKDAKVGAVLCSSVCGHGGAAGDGDRLQHSPWGGGRGLCFECKCGEWEMVTWG